MTRPRDPETEQPGPSSQSSSFHNDGGGDQFNSPRGMQNINTGGGNQFIKTTFNAPDRFPPHTRRDEENMILKRLNTLPYRDRKDRNPERVPGTCDWFVNHIVFRKWKENKSSTILWVSAEPGCGKSVLVKYLVDSVLPTTESRTVCYFFFKDIDDQRNVVSALCCILYQLFMQKRILLSEKIFDRFNTGRETFTNSFSELWDTLIEATEDKSAGEIICLLDAIDECEDQGWSRLARALHKLSDKKSNLNLKFLLTSRLYGGIRRDLQPLPKSRLPVIHLSGESDDEKRKISLEIKVFIRAKVADIGAQLLLTQDEQGLLLQQLMLVPNGTYIWVYLILDLIKNDISVNKTKIVEATSHLPETVNEAYDRILSKSRNSEEAKKILHIVVAAARPLTLREMKLALAVQENHRSYDEPGLESESEDRLREKIRDICGLFVTIIDSKIYLLHQTAKEFLVQDDTVNSPKSVHGDLKWKHSLGLRESHRILTEICIWHLFFAEFESHPLDENGALPQYVERHVFLDYSAKHWAAHLRELPIKMQKAMTPLILRICDTSSKRFLTWFRIYWTSTNTDFSRGFTTLMIASYFGLSTAVKLLLKIDGINVNSRDDTYRRSALSWAAGNGFDDVVKLLIRGAGISLNCLKSSFGKGAEVDSMDTYRLTPLSYAAWNGNVAVVKLLIKAGANAASKDKIGGTPLYYAVCSEHEEMIELLLEKGTQVGSGDDIRKKLLFTAAKKGHAAAVRMLLDTGRVDSQVKDNGGWTPLSWAAKNGHEAVVKLLLDSGVDPNSSDVKSRTPLSWSAKNGHEAVVKLLLDSGVDPNSSDVKSRTPLSLAAKNGHEAVVKLLLDSGADPNIKDDNSRTPLLYAAEEGRETVVKVLLEKRADPNIKDDTSRTPLLRATQNGHEAVVKLLLDSGADPNIKDDNSRTPLLYAAEEGRETVVKVLLEKKADPNIKDDTSRTPLLYAAERGHEIVVKQLLVEKVTINAQDAIGATALHWVAWRRHEAVMSLLLKNPVDIDIREKRGATPLAWAIESGFKMGIKMLLAKNCDVNYWYRLVSIPKPEIGDLFLELMTNTACYRT